ncbi:hypothetical protein AB4144_60640, partial [Rhizobiaceae sp. 2RAB30]
FALSDGGAITTSGQGSTGVLVQSIGGGGGAGGDSTSLATVVGYDTPDSTASLAITATMSVGGNGGVGGDGGEVLVALGGTLAADGTFSQDATGSAGTAIVTYG